MSIKREYKMGRVYKMSGELDYLLGRESQRPLIWRDKQGGLFVGNQVMIYYRAGGRVEKDGMEKG